MRHSFTPHDALEYVALPAFHDNYIWLVSDGHNAIVVDPGDAAPVRIYLRERGWRLRAILLTHHHSDHVGGVAHLLRESEAPVYGPTLEATHLVTHRLKGKDRVHLAAPQLTFSVLDIPGHTLGHIAFFIDGAGNAPSHVFCGDTLFACGCGRLFEGTPQQMLASLDALAALPDATRVHCGHEYTLANIRFAQTCDPENSELRIWQREAAALRTRNRPTLPTTIGQEKRLNPFLRVGAAAIQQQLAGRVDDANDRLAVFTALRAWKDCF